MIQILLIENDTADATWTRAFLEKVYSWDMEIRQASSIDEAVEVLRTDFADVILVAVQPATEGWDEAIKQLDMERPSTPIVVLVPEASDTIASDAFAAGAVEFLVKGQITINWIRRAINYAIHRKHLTDLIRKAESLHLGIISLSADAIVSTDVHQRIALFNLAAEQMFGYSANEALGQPLEMLIPAPARTRHSEHVKRFEEGPATSRRMNARGTVMGVRSSGELFPAEVSISKLLTPDGAVFTAIIRDTTERMRVEEQLRDLAMTDPLTGIANRRRVLDVAEQERQRSHRYGHPLSVLVIDLDHFKDINDRFGHAAGDLALLRVTIASHEILRGNDVLGRVGGDEFMALLPETDEGQAEILALRLVEHIAKLEIPYEGKTLKLSVTVGCSVVGDSDVSINEAVERADGALLEAKRRGRNSVLSWGRMSAGTDVG